MANDFFRLYSDKKGVTMKTTILKGCTILLAIVLFFENVHAQISAYDASDRIQIGFSFQKPFIKSNNTTISALSGIYQLSAKIPLGEKVNIVGNLPYLLYKYEDNFDYYNFSGEDNSIGNLFVGLQFIPKWTAERSSWATIGVYLPTADEKVGYMGMLMDYYDDLNFYPNTIGVYFNYAQEKMRDEGFCYRWDLGPNIAIPSKKNQSSTQVFVHYAVSPGVKISSLLLNAEFKGTLILSGNANTFTDRLLNQLGFGAQWIGPSVTPKVFYRIYLKEAFREIISGVLGIGVTVSLN
jgi:hypothetical protein